jgi:glycosyltransferase involved in cell wall biosynthesis
MSTKIILITNIPTPYRIPLFNELAKQFQNQQTSFKVIFNAKSYQRRKWQVDESQFKFEYIYLINEKLASTKEQTKFTYKGIVNIIKKEEATHFVVPGFSRATLKLILCSFFVRFKLIVWTGTVEQKKVNWLKLLYRRLISKFVDQWIVYSLASKRYLEKIGVNAQKIQVSLNTVDTTFFLKGDKAIEKSTNDSFTLGFVGELSVRKNPFALIDIIEELCKTNSNFNLNIIGDGDQKSRLEAYINQKNVQNYVNLLGYIQKNELPKIYSSFDLFLFQTDFDIWGLVLNEAMASGLPILASDKAISSLELIENNKNGLLVNFDETKKVSEIILSLKDQKKRLVDLGIKAKQTIIEKATIEKSAADFIMGINNAK